MTLYLDSSALVKLFVPEQGSDLVVSQSKAANLLASALITYAETRSAFAAIHRDHRLSTPALATSKNALDQTWSDLHKIAINDTLVRHAGALAERHGLRGYDAVQLACFAWLRRSSDDHCRFLSFDARLMRAAESLR